MEKVHSPRKHQPTQVEVLVVQDTQKHSRVTQTRWVVVVVVVLIAHKTEAQHPKVEVEDKELMVGTQMAQRTRVAVAVATSQAQILLAQEVLVSFIFRGRRQRQASVHSLGHQPTERMGQILGLELPQREI